METTAQRLNVHLVKLFNNVLRVEEAALRAHREGDLSLKEMHVIDTVALCQTSDKNRPTAIARELHVTPGTLTTAVNLLIKKGYLASVPDAKDKRSKRIVLTEKGEAANATHRRFHEEMVRGILSAMTEEETEIFLEGLANVDRFFDTTNDKNKERNTL